MAIVKLEMFGLKIIKDSPYGYSIDDGKNVLWIQPEARHGFIYANLKSVLYKKSNRVYTAYSMLNKYQGLADLIANELAKTEPIYDYYEHVFYDPKNPNGYWKRKVGDL